jgi:rRNA maturation endonuclease Nob1
VVGLPERIRWADTEQGRRIISGIRTFVARWKAAGHDVSELEEYLASADPNPRGIDARLRPLLKRINEPWPGELGQLGQPRCPTCGALAKPFWETCTSCGSVMPREIHMSTPQGRKDWPDAGDNRERLAALRSTLRGWKDAGYDVSGLEAYMDSPDATPEEVNSRLEALLHDITRNMKVQATKSNPPECPHCFADLGPKDVKCPSCGKPVPRPGRAVPPDRCPQCKGRVGPNDRKCPVCGHRLKPWKLFG